MLDVLQLKHAGKATATAVVVVVVIAAVAAIFVLLVGVLRIGGEGLELRAVIHRLRLSLLHEVHDDEWLGGVFGVVVE